MEPNVRAPSAVNNHANAAQFATTVTQKTAWNERLRDLCRKRSWAINAPGQPPTSARRCNVLSLVRQVPRVAADLSMAYTTNVAALATRYNGRTNAGMLDAAAAPPTANRKPTASDGAAALGLRLVLAALLAPANSAFPARILPFESVDTV